MNVLTRELINKSIEFVDRTADRKKSSVPFKKLSKKIDFVKNLLQGQGAEKGNSVIIGVQPSTFQTACIFACLELGLTIAIIDYGRKDQFAQYSYMDPKTELLLPIEFFIVSEYDDSEKFEFFKGVCSKTIQLDLHNPKDPELSKRNPIVLADQDTIAIKCTSSGTTGTPKVIEHPHEFLLAVVLRNSSLYDNVVGIINNLNHGSSIATYYLPALASPKVTKFVHLFSSPRATPVKDLDHLMLPYKHQLLEACVLDAPSITYYTLSVIPSALSRFHEKKRFKEIISFFGSNETSGPTLINRVSSKNFRENRYFKLDDFYDINVVDRELHVTLPVYNKVHCTNDIFTQEGDTYLFDGRADLFRVNDHVIPLNDYHEIASQTATCDLIYDTARSAIYLAFWGDQPDVNKKVKRINKELNRLSGKVHFVDKFAVLDQEEFLTGVKLDQELVREYFRRYVEYRPNRD